MRKKIVAGNWKMNNTLDEAKTLISEVANMLADEKQNDTIAVLCPPFPYLGLTKRLLGDHDVAVGAQNCHEEDSGAYTGEVSAVMLKPMGVDYVILGHSERREYFEESDELLAKKVSKAFEHGLAPIFCCGESLDIREAGTHVDHVKNQLTNSLFHLSAEEMSSLVIAYEPIWAIGTGRTASAEQAQDMHKALRDHIATKYGQEVADSVPIQYGGSVKPGNAVEIFGQPDVDGGLIGGASLKSRDFVDIVKAI